MESESLEGDALDELLLKVSSIDPDAEQAPAGATSAGAS
jgi:hypothetical protein